MFICLTFSFSALIAAINEIPSWLSALSGIIAAASAVTALTPTPNDDTVVGRIYRVVEMLALNIGHAKDQPSNKSAD